MSNHIIKFRGKRIDNGEWVYGFLYQYQGKLFISKEIIENPTYSDPGGTWIYNEYEVNPETVGQFTGLHDKDGREIYERDIVKNMEHNFVFKVQWGIQNESYAGWAGNWLGKDFISPLFNGPLENCEVIGNIHDNPELI